MTTPKPGDFGEPWEVISEGCSTEKFYTVVGTIYSEKSGVIVDTLNCHHCLTIEEQKERCDRIAACVNALAAEADVSTVAARLAMADEIIAEVQEWQGDDIALGGKTRRVVTNYIMACMHLKGGTDGKGT